MLKKITGIVGVLAVAGVVAMVALSPRAEGFFPGMLDFLKLGERTEVSSETDAPQIETGTIDATKSIVPELAGTSYADTLSVEERAMADTLVSEE